MNAPFQVKCAEKAKKGNGVYEPKAQRRHCLCTIAFYTHYGHLSTPCTKNIFCFGQVDKIAQREYNTHDEQRRSSEVFFASVNAFAHFYSNFKAERMRKMKPEGQVRIPSGCAIAALISKDGNRLMLRGIGLTDKELQILGVSHAGA